jgi:hypothetical protein
VPDYLKERVLEQGPDIPQGTRKEIVKAKDLMPLGEQGGAQMGSHETRSARN